jgi:tetratricopeptide (TPR) repeat protein
MMNGSPLETRSGPRLAARFGIILGLLGACSAQTPGPSFAVAGPSSFAGLAGEASAGGTALGDYLAGSYALSTGQLDQASVFLERALAADPDDPDLLRQVYLLTLASGRYDHAVALAEGLIAIEPADEEAQLLLALQEARAGHLEAASEALEAIGLRLNFANNFSLTADYGWQLSELPYPVEDRSRGHIKATLAF